VENSNTEGAQQSISLFLATDGLKPKTKSQGLRVSLKHPKKILLYGTVVRT